MWTLGKPRGSKIDFFLHFIGGGRGLVARVSSLGGGELACHGNWPGAVLAQWPWVEARHGAEQILCARVAE